MPCCQNSTLQLLKSWFFAPRELSCNLIWTLGKQILGILKLFSSLSQWYLISFKTSFNKSRSCHRHQGFKFRRQGWESGAKKTCWSYLKDAIVMVSTLFTECQNFAPFRSYRRFNVLALWLFYSNISGHFWHFLYFFWL